MKYFCIYEHGEHNINYKLKEIRYSRSGERDCTEYHTFTFKSVNIPEGGFFLKRPCKVA